MATFNLTNLKIEKYRQNMLSYKLDIRKILTVFYILNFIQVISAQHDSLPLTADGWRPIISSRPQQPDIKYYQDSVAAEAIRQHTVTTAVPYNNQQNQNQNYGTAKPTPKQQYANVNNSPGQNATQNHNPDITKQTKYNTGKIRTNQNVIPSVNLGKIFGGNQDIILHGNYPSTRNHINVMSHNMKVYSTISPYAHNFGNINTHRHPVMGKLQAHMTISKRRKPSQHHSATTRDEVYLSPPSGILGNYPFFHTAPIKGIATIHHGSAGKHYILPGTLPPHIEFPSHYSPVSIVNDDLIKQFVRDNNPQIGNQYFYSKHTVQNNLAAPPFKALYNPEIIQHAIGSEQKQKLENIKVYSTAATINDPQLIIGKHKFTDVKKLEKEKVVVPENIVVQLPPPHNSEHLQKPKTEVELEITKENFNVFQNDIPPNYNPHPQLQNFFPSDAKTAPSLALNTAHTYEVTEGKYDETTSYPLLPQKNSKTKFINQISSSIDAEEDNVTFLPTPHKPSKNRTKASPIYDSLPNNNFKQQYSNDYYSTQTDLNKYQYNHYDDLPTQLSVPSKDSERINYAHNEITTVLDYDFPSGSTASPSNHRYTIQNFETTSTPTTERLTRRPKITTTTTIVPRQSTRTYQRTRNPNRRRKPASRTTTVTTPFNENQVATQSADESKIVETSYQTTTNTQPKYTKFHRTTSAPVTQESQTISQTTLASTVPTRNKYTFSTEQYDEVTEKFHKHRARPADFVDDFEDSEYLQRKYQGFDNSKPTYNNRYRNHKPYEDEMPTEPTYEYSGKKIYTKNIRNKSTYESQDYPNFETTRQSEIDTVSSKVYPTEFYASNTDYTIPQKYAKTTTSESNQLDGQESIENFEIAKIEKENEVDFKTQKETTTLNENIKEIPTTKFSNIHDKLEIKEIITTPEPETTTLLKTTTTTAETTTPKSYRLRPKPSRKRPIFSVSIKDHQSRLQTSTTEASKVSPETISTRIRFPPRLQVTSTSTAAPSSEETNNEDTIENTSSKYSSDIRKFVPSESRYKSTTERNSISTTRKSYNSYRPNRVRPTPGKYNRHRTTTTTEMSNTAAVIPAPKVVIKPSSTLLRRPQTISLRNRIANKQKLQEASTTSSSTTSEQNNFSDDMETTKSHTDDAQSTFSSLDSAETSYTNKWNLRPEVSSHRFNIEELFEHNSESNNQHTIISDERKDSDDLSHVSYSQRIADLTSLSANQQDHSKNGVFKTIPSNTSRRVPNYFTIATDDPILPIEAFFPQISQKESNKNK